MNIKFITIIILFSTFLGCGHKEGIIQREPKGYLWFTGNTKHAFVSIDDTNPFELKKSYEVDEETGEKIENSKEIHYQVAPGKHKVIVKKDGRIVVNRVILIGNDMTKEIEIP